MRPHEPQPLPVSRVVWSSFDTSPGFHREIDGAAVSMDQIAVLAVALVGIFNDWPAGRRAPRARPRV